MLTSLSGHGITIGLPATWEGRISHRTAAGPAIPQSTSRQHSAFAWQNQPDQVDQPDTERPGGEEPGAVSSLPGNLTIGAPRERTRPLVHLASFALPSDRGDFGSGAVDVMGADDILISLVEYGPECLGTALFANEGLPQPLPGQFDPNTLQRRIRGQYGYQRFVTVNQRPFCVYIVIGSAHGLGMRTTEAREVLAHTRIESR